MNVTDEREETENIESIADAVEGEESVSPKQKKGALLVRRCLDIFFSSLLIVILLPFLLLFALLVIITDSKGGAIYRHERIGLNGRVFTMYKFRTMKSGAKIEDVLTPEELERYRKEFKVKNDPRITKLGSFLRKTSIDELPQLFNILKGDMSFVGPRPVTYEETTFYGENRDLLLSVKPGLTGYWQAYARNAVTYENGKRQEMELYYVKNQSFLLDIKILFRTVGKVLSRKDVY